MYSRILVPLDGSPTAQRGFEEALQLAKALGASLRVLNIVDARQLLVEVSGTVPPQQLLDDWKAAGVQVVERAVAAAKAQGVAAEADVRCEPGFRVCDLIVRVAQETGCELIVMGTHGRRGLKRVALGSDAELVLRDSPVPVLLVREPDGEQR